MTQKLEKRHISHHVPEFLFGFALDIVHIYEFLGSGQVFILTLSMSGLEK